jgi:hypothetical protein
MAVCVGSGLMLIAAGEFVRRQPAIPVAMPFAPPSAVLTAEPIPVAALTLPIAPIERNIASPPIGSPAAPRASRASLAAPARRSTAPRPVRLVPMTPGNFGRTDHQSVTSAARTVESDVRKARSPRTPHGILDHLRFRWLRGTSSTPADGL